MEIVADTPGYRDTIFCSPTTISSMKWDPARYMDHRVTMVKTIMAMFKKKHEERGQKCAHALPLLSRRLELCLCLTASTFDEYFNMYSLKRRMHSLVLLLMSDSTIKPHEFLPPGFGTSRISLQLKRQAMDHDTNPVCKKRKIVSSKTSLSSNSTYSCVHKPFEKSNYLLNNHEDLLRTIYGFLTGMETVRHQVVNRFTNRFMRTCVKSLVLSLNTFVQVTDEFDMTDFLKSFPNLEDIHIGNIENMGDMEFPQVRGVSLRSEHQRRPRENEKLVKNFAAALEAKAAPKLKYLSLASVFCSSPSNIATYALLNAFQSGGCPQLEYFGYSGNSTRDDGALIIAKYLSMGACKKLRCLDLRQNFIGVRGLEAISKSLCNGGAPNIEALCFGGNILVDDAICHLLEVVASENCKKIRFLGLEHNFITSRGITRLATRRSSAQIVDLSKMER